MGADYWTEERIAKLKSLVGKNSASEIAAELGGGISRNAVIGKMKRMNLAGRSPIRLACVRVPLAPKPAKPTEGYAIGSHAFKVTRAIKALRDGTDAPPKPLPTMRQADVEPLHIPLRDLTGSNCHWPFGDQAPFTFCGCRTERNQPYCTAHAALSKGSGSFGERAATRINLRRVA